MKINNKFKKVKVDPYEGEQVIILVTRHGKTIAELAVYLGIVDYNVSTGKADVSRISVQQLLS